MISDLEKFKEMHGLLCLNSSPNRIFIYIDSIQKIPTLNNFRQDYSKITVLSNQPLNIDLPNIVVTKTKKVNQKTHPGDIAAYQILGKGFKEYDYFLTSLVFIKKQD